MLLFPSSRDAGEGPLPISDEPGEQSSGRRLKTTAQSPSSHIPHTASIQGHCLEHAWSRMAGKTSCFGVSTPISSEERLLILPDSPIQ